MIPSIYDEGFTEGTKIDEEETGEEIEIMTKNSNVEEDEYPYSVEVYHMDLKMKWMPIYLSYY